MDSGIDERDHNVSRALGDAQSLVVVGESARVHKHPAGLGVGDAAVVAYEAAATALVVHAHLVQGDVYRVCRAVVVGLQARLLVRTVAHHEVHQRTRRLWVRMLEGK